MDVNKLRSELIQDEGKRYKPYKDILGKLTVGVGRNLDDNGLYDNEIIFLLDNDINRCIIDVQNNLSFYFNLDEIRQRVLVNLCFNMGIGGLLTFEKMLTFIRGGAYQLASEELKNSKWWNQVGISRRERLYEQLKTGLES